MSSDPWKHLRDTAAAIVTVAVAGAPIADAFGIEVPEIPTEVAEVFLTATGSTVSDVSQAGLPTAVPVPIRVRIAQPLVQAGETVPLPPLVEYRRRIAGGGSAAAVVGQSRYLGTSTSTGSWD